MADRVDTASLAQKEPKTLSRDSACTVSSTDSADPSRVERRAEHELLNVTPHTTEVVQPIRKVFITDTELPTHEILCKDSELPRRDTSDTLADAPAAAPPLTDVP